MAKSIYITPLGPESGKGLVSLGVMDLLVSQVGRVGYFRPVIAGRPEDDSQVQLMKTRYDQNGLDAGQMFGAEAAWARECLLGGKQSELLKRIIERFEEARRKCDFMLCEGTDFRGHTAAFEFEFNLDVASNLGCALLPVISGRDRTPGEIADALGLGFAEVKEQGLALAAMVVNRVAPGEGEALVNEIEGRLPGDASAPVYALEASAALERRTMGDVARQIEATVLHGEGEELNREVRGFKVAAMRIPNFLEHVEDGSLVITAGDRSDVVLACAATLMSDRHPKIAGLMLTGGLVPEPSVVKLLQGLRASHVSVPVLSVTCDTYAATEALRKVEPALAADNASRVAAALAVFEAGVDTADFEAQLKLERPERITPMMFEHRLTERAKADRKHIVLPEGEEERILRATEILLRRGVVEVTLLGDPAAIERKAAALALEVRGAEMIDPAESSLREEFAETYYELRKHKGISLEAARDVMTDVSYFGTMMVHKGLADGMVSGSVHTTQHTIRPSFEIIKAREGFAIVSSVFLMCLKDRVLVYGDCAVNPNPTAGQLADIALASAETAEQFGIEPRVAMLSYSTGQSGKGSDVEAVREAARIAHQRRPDLPLEGPIQYDAAIDASVAETKLPGSEVAGRATVFIFPDLNTGNNTYKAVQRSAGAVAIGPVLQGLNKPVNDLSRGCTVTDITNTVAITAIQAQQSEAATSRGDMNILVINSGSSSIKYRLYEMPEGRELAAGLVEKIGESGSRLEHRWQNADGTSSERVEEQALSDHAAGFQLADRVMRETLGDAVAADAIGHRVVHGGEKFSAPTRIDAEVLETIRGLTPLAPLHNPANLTGIEVALRTSPDTPQVAVFDTAFHQTMPARAFLYAVPDGWYREHGVRRYGFHGTSHHYVAKRAAVFLGKPLEALNLITIHLGNGASAAAIETGKSVDTTMGLTPLEGLVMGTRCGDIDPAIPFHVSRSSEMSLEEVEAALNRESGLRGLCGENDMRSVLAKAEAGDERARSALEVYTYRIRKVIGAYAAVLGRVDAVVFTAGIGENSAEVRAASCAGLEAMGIDLDAAANGSGSGEAFGIHADGSRIAVLVVATNEELEIATATLELVTGGE